MHRIGRQIPKQNIYPRDTPSLLSFFTTPEDRYKWTCCCSSMVLCHNGAMPALFQYLTQLCNNHVRIVPEHVRILHLSSAKMAVFKRVRKMKPLETSCYVSVNSLQ